MCWARFQWEREEAFRKWRCGSEFTHQAIGHLVRTSCAIVGEVNGGRPGADARKLGVLIAAVKLCWRLDDDDLMRCGQGARSKSTLRLSILRLQALNRALGALHFDVFSASI